MLKLKLIALASLTLATLGVASNFAGTPGVRDLMADKGSLKGHVTNSKGTPAVGVLVQVFAPIDFGGSGGGSKRSAGFEVVGGQSPTLLQGKGTVLAKTMTDANGDFQIKSIDAGSFSYRVGTRTTGMNGGRVTIEAGKETVIDVKLNDPAPR
jgi:hypothetical protein